MRDQGSRFKDQLEVYEDLYSVVFYVAAVYEMQLFNLAHMGGWTGWGVGAAWLGGRPY